MLSDPNARRRRARALNTRSRLASAPSAAGEDVAISAPTAPGVYDNPLEFVARTTVAGARERCNAASHDRDPHFAARATQAHLVHPQDKSGEDRLAVNPGPHPGTFSGDRGAHSDIQ